MLKNKKRKKRIIIITIVILLLLISLAIIFRQKDSENEDGNTMQNIEELSTIEEVLENFDCRYISEKELNEGDFEREIYVEFSRDLYTNGEDNKTFFKNICQVLAEVLDYENFKLIDEEKEIIIHVVNSKETQVVVAMIINGDINYFGNKNSENTLKNYEEFQVTNMQIQSSILNNLINSDWNTRQVNFGTKDGEENSYSIYEDEGIKIRSIARKVYNIVFTGNYTENIINNINTKTSREDIIKILGEPTFEEEYLDLYGYKGNDIYVFFANGEISAYRVEKEYKTDEIMDALENFQQEKSIKNFTNTITDIWNDYDLYERGENFVNLRYSLKGLQIAFNLTSNHGIIIYNNYNGELVDGITIEELANGTKDIPRYIFFELDKDLVFESEISRVGYEQAKGDIGEDF